MSLSDDLPTITVGPWTQILTLTVSGTIAPSTLSLASVGTNIFLFGVVNYATLPHSVSWTQWKQPIGSTPPPGLSTVQFNVAPTPGSSGPPFGAATAVNQLTLIWAGVAPNDLTMWMNNYSNSSWMGGQTNLVIPPGYGVLASTGPAFAVLNGFPYLLWAGSQQDGYWYSSSDVATPTANSWSSQTLMKNSGPPGGLSLQGTPYMVPALDPTGASELLTLWPAPTVDGIIYGTISPTSSGTVIGELFPMNSTLDFSATSVSVPLPDGNTAPIPIVLWRGGQCQVYAMGSWRPAQTMSGQWPSGMLPANFASCFVAGATGSGGGNAGTLYVAWVTPTPSVSVISAPVSYTTVS